MRPYKRRYRLVHPLQYRLLAAGVIYFFSVLALAALIVFGPIIISIGNPDEDALVSYQLANTLLLLHGRFWPAFTALVALIAIHSIFLSHRVAGPLYRFNEVFKAVGSGDISGVIRLRKNDYLEREAEQINMMLGSLREKIGRAQEISKNLNVDLNGPNREAGLDASQLSRLRDYAEALERALGEFKIH